MRASAAVRTEHGVVLEAGQVILPGSVTAAALLAAEDTRTDREPLTDEWSGLDLATAYRVQDETLRRRQARGERLVGVKLGLTSRAKQQRMGVDSPLTAWLTDAMTLPAGVPVRQERLIHPRVEPELVFVMRDRLPVWPADGAIACTSRRYAARWSALMSTDRQRRLRGPTR